MTGHFEPRPDETLILVGRLMELDHGQHGYLLRDDVGHEFALSDYQPSTVVICENVDSAQQLPQMPGTIAFEGDGDAGVALRVQPLPVLPYLTAGESELLEHLCGPGHAQPRRIEQEQLSRQAAVDLIVAGSVVQSNQAWGRAAMSEVADSNVLSHAQVSGDRRDTSRSRVATKALRSTLSNGSW